MWHAQDFNRRILIRRVEPWLALALLATCGPTAPAAQPLLTPAQPAAVRTVAVAWHSNVETAWTATREQGRPLLVFVTRDHCHYCVQMKDRTYGHPGLAATINRSFVPLVLNGSTASPLLKELQVNVYPCTFVISPQAVVLARIDGYVPPEAMAQRLGTLWPAMGAVQRAGGH